MILYVSNFLSRFFPRQSRFGFEPDGTARATSSSYSLRHRSKRRRADPNFSGMEPEPVIKSDVDQTKRMSLNSGVHRYRQYPSCHVVTLMTPVSPGARLTDLDMCAHYYAPCVRSHSTSR
eukprot:881038_1